MTFFLKQSEAVLKPVKNIGANARLSAFESDIEELKSLLFSNESFYPHKNETNGLGRIRTDDLRRVKTEDLAFFAFFVFGRSRKSLNETYRGSMFV
jgi:hypothetical protein